ncbi:hypothetical protein RRG08_062817 [Elysia crispata]|uniref:Uncharacterized protein n=1 Tax=Elysia crispata TaxID=231223 RepID=A0AAE0XWZ6_9GAST|nr:hypothetical protein RRG08_062817 [Elysia crispata]
MCHVWRRIVNSSLLLEHVTSRKRGLLSLRMLNQHRVPFLHRADFRSAMFARRLASVDSELNDADLKLNINLIGVWVKYRHNSDKSFSTALAVGAHAITSELSTEDRGIACSS